MGFGVERLGFGVWGLVGLKGLSFQVCGHGNQASAKVFILALLAAPILTRPCCLSPALPPPSCLQSLLLPPQPPTSPLRCQAVLARAAAFRTRKEDPQHDGREDRRTYQPVLR
jgi:hypothetical protein